MENNLNELMQQRKEKVFQFISSKEYTPMKEAELAYLLTVPTEEAHLFDEVIKELLKECKIIITKKQKLMTPEKAGYIIGTFIGTSMGYGFVKLDEPGLSDIYIPEDYINGAIHSDKVLVSITEGSPSSYKPRGEVVKVLSRGIKEIIGIFGKYKKQGFVMPDNKKIGQYIFVSNESCKDIEIGSKVVAQITKWLSGKSPEGIICEVIKADGDTDVNVVSLIRQFELPMSFEQKVLDELNAIPEEVFPEEYENRVDLMNEVIITIDGIDSKDLDDAVSLKILENGNYLLGVHIADVTHYVKENSELDREALNRGNSVYLLNKVLPMLPPKLSNGICSLNGGVERLTLSCSMEIDKYGVVVSHEVYEAVIKTVKRMTYDEVTTILISPDDIDKSMYDERIISMLNKMQELAQVLRENRRTRGSIDFDMPESKIILDKHGKTLDVFPYDRNIATQIIEEFMLICNETIAEHYFWLELPFVYRSHEQPDSEKIKSLSDFIVNFGYHLKGSVDIHPKAVQKLLDEAKGRPEEHIISQAALRSLKQARYTDTNDGHFGLSAKYYCHFTSPIRRYSDLQIHRIIKFNLHSMGDDAYNKKIDRLKKIIPDVAKQCSVRERVAEEAEREVNKLKKAEYMSDKIGQMFDGIISSVTSWGIYVELPNTVEGMVSLNSLIDYYIFDSKRLLYVGEFTKNVFRIGDKVKVMLTGVNITNRTIDFTFPNS